MSATQHPLRIAHRGGAGLAPENTLAAFRLGLAHEAEAMELDLHMSQDGALVVMHDPDVRRVTGVPGEIGALTLEALRRLNVAATYAGTPIDPQRVPILQEVLELVRGRAEVQAPGFVEVLTEEGRDRILGATLVGHDAGEQIAPLCVMMNNRLGLAALGKTVLPYPTRAEYLRRLSDAYGRTRLTPLVARVLRGWLRWLA